MWCSSGPTPVAIAAAATGVTDGNVDTHSGTYVPRSLIAASAGAWPCSIARSSISGLSASITARTSFFGFASLTAELAEYAQAFVLLVAPAARPYEEHDEADQSDEAKWGEHERQRGDQE